MIGGKAMNRQVIKLFYKGLSTREIADELDISEFKVVQILIRIDTFRFNKCRGYTTERERLVAADVLLDNIKVVIGTPTPIELDGDKIRGVSLMDDI